MSPIDEIRETEVGRGLEDTARILRLEDATVKEEGEKMAGYEEGRGYGIAVKRLRDDYYVSIDTGEQRGKEKDLDIDDGSPKSEYFFLSC